MARKRKAVSKTTAKVVAEKEVVVEEPKVVEAPVIEEVSEEEKMLRFMQMKESFARGKLLRRTVRRQLFKIRRGIELNNGLKEWVENQFDNNRQQNWTTFTFTWDVSPSDPFKIIIKEEWISEGGSFDDSGFRKPPGFTKQEV